MIRKILKGIGILLALLVIAIVLLVVNTSLQYKKLKAGELEDSFTCDTIPFTYTRSGHILLKAQINSSKEDYFFILDSGAKNFIFKNLSKKYNFKNNGFAIGLDANRNFFFPRIKKINSIQIGSARFNDINAEETELNFDCTEEVSGIIGTGLMRHLAWEIDFQKQLIIISRELNTDKTAENAIVIPLKENPYSHHLSTRIKFRNNKKAKNVLIDLGNNTTLYLNEDVVLEDSITLKQKEIIGRGTEGLAAKNKKRFSKNRYYLLDSLIFSNSDYFVKNVPVYTSPRGINLLGLDFFNRYKTTISWKDQQLMLVPNDSIQNFMWKTFGFSTKYNKELNKVEIVSIVENSPASQAEVPVYSELVSINGKTLSDSLSYCEYREIRSENDTITIEVIHNDSIKAYNLTLEPLFY